MNERASSDTLDTSNSGGPKTYVPPFLRGGNNNLTEPPPAQQEYRGGRDNREFKDNYRGGNNRRYEGRGSDRQERGGYNNYNRGPRRDDSYQNGE